MKLLIYLLLTLWRIKANSIPQLYYPMSNGSTVDVSEIRKLEKLHYRCAKLKLDVKYFDDCQELDVCPKFLQIKTPNLAAYQNTKTFYRQAVNNQLKAIKHDLESTLTQYHEVEKDIHSKLSYFQWIVLKSSISKHTLGKCTTVRERHKTKLLALWKRERFRSPNAVINLSSRKLTINEENALRCGLNHHILPSKVDPNIVKINVEKLFTSLNSSE